MRLIKRWVSRSQRIAPDRLSMSELMQCLRNGVTTASQAQRLIREARIASLWDEAELSTPECAYYLCRSRYFVGSLIRAGILAAEPRWKADGTWAYRVQAIDLRRFARTLGA
jgi:hypothetical protein